MKIISKTLKLLPLLLFALVLQACSSDDDSGTTTIPQELNIVETAQATPVLSSLVTAIQAADGDLGTLLSGNGPFTVLAPTNDAFTAFLNGTPLDQVDTAVLEQILRNHVISADVSAAGLVSLSGADGKGYTKTNAAGAGGENLSLLFDTSSALPRFNNTANVVSADLADISASNGTVHVIDAVLGLPNIVDHALNNDNFTSLTGALTSENLVTTLQGDGPFTVFAPTNDAFTTFTNPNGNILSNILLNHVLVGTTALSSGLSSSYVSTGATNADGDALSLYVNVGDNVKLNGSTMVVVTDIVGTNGVVHVVDNVIDLPTIATFATTNDALENLVSALQLADTGMPTVPWIETVSDSSAGPYTVFAPTDNAFEDLLLELDPTGNTTLGDIDPTTVDAVLLVHVVNGNVRAEDLQSLMGTVPTLGGDLSLDINTLTLTDALMREIGIIAELTDVQAVNGVVHVVDRVIRP
ncbi:fasciclin domain-containing protein [Psychroserpens ponticola]|uniref:Fasciclin domain-containing protein n=1 Tax=Psychroserpens ponticola TaxID=2932268 RepID=A0ABY7RZI9_9FLAO|nr:fasciclin domain-containing protein [Psychroserpens ponticola]WCO02482.1 fasciclin domain-containing protein [Psychroserpens ponticola]